MIRANTRALHAVSTMIDGGDIRVTRRTPAANGMLEMFEYDSSHAFGVFGNLAINMWRGEFRQEHITVSRARWQRLSRSKGTFGLLVIVLPSAPPPSGQMRDAIMKTYSEYSSSIRAVGTVLEDQGLRGAAGAMAMTTIMLMSKPPFAYRNGTNLASIASWLSNELPDRPTTATIVAATEEVRRRYATVCAEQYRESLLGELK